MSAVAINPPSPSHSASSAASSRYAKARAVPLPRNDSAASTPLMRPSSPAAKAPVSFQVPRPSSRAGSAAGTADRSPPHPPAAPHRRPSGAGSHAPSSPPSTAQHSYGQATPPAPISFDTAQAPHIEVTLPSRRQSSPGTNSPPLPPPAGATLQPTALRPEDSLGLSLMSLAPTPSQVTDLKPAAPARTPMADNVISPLVGVPVGAGFDTFALDRKNSQASSAAAFNGMLDTFPAPHNRQQLDEGIEGYNAASNNYNRNENEYQGQKSPLVNHTSVHSARSGGGSVRDTTPMNVDAASRRQSVHNSPRGDLGSVGDALKEELGGDYGSEASHRSAVTGAARAIERELGEERERARELEEKNSSLHRLLQTSSSADKVKLAQQQDELAKRAKKIKSLETLLRRCKTDVRRMDDDLAALRRQLDAKAKHAHEQRSPPDAREQPRFDETVPTNQRRTPSHRHSLSPGARYSRNDLSTPPANYYRDSQRQSYSTLRSEDNLPVRLNSMEPLRHSMMEPESLPDVSLPDALAVHLRDVFNIETTHDVSVLAKHLCSRAQLSSPIRQSELRTSHDVNRTALNILYDYTCSPAGSPLRSPSA
ncbi:hypothetical protein DIPPA_25124 [Diplonema papillatum]|nr:hypothetical protein DIPPA_25124 [Diplonema papillatum]